MIAVEVEDEAWREMAAVEALVEQAAGAALISLHDRDGTARGGMSGDLAVLLTDDVTIRELNARFRGKDAATNVLSFPAAESAHPHLGDIALAHGVCAAEAAAQGKLLAHHLAHLVVHGVLHLLGHDHDADAEAEAMEARERAVLERLGIADPYSHEGAHV